MKRQLHVALTLAGLCLTGCKTIETVSQVGGAVGVATGAMTPEEAAALDRAAVAVGKTFEAFTPEQEYYLGRTVTATLLASFPAWEHQAANEYVNLVGQYLALWSERPETFAGYHFLILNTEDINAFAAPGGFILVSRGLLRCCRNEDELAAVLAHEIAHVTLKHGLQAIRKSRITDALTLLAAESAKTLGGQELAELTRTFEASVADITATLVNSGYSRRFEHEADAEAVKILRRAGYDPHALVGMLQVMQQRLRPGARDFAQTHPDPHRRIRALTPLLGPAVAPAPAAREQRFARVFSQI